MRIRGKAVKNMSAVKAEIELQPARGSVPAAEFKNIVESFRNQPRCLLEGAQIVGIMNQVRARSRVEKERRWPADTRLLQSVFPARLPIFSPFQISQLLDRIWREDEKHRS